MQWFEAAVEPQHKPQPASVSDGGLLDTIRPYLSEEDQTTGICYLKPASKRDVTHLIGYVLRGHMLPVHLNLWHVFVFVTCKDEAMEQRLARLHKAIIEEVKDSHAIFRELQIAGRKTS
jgi:hypothetical protein